ncbi:MAG TPA: hypothetical protein VH062_35730 [Polyangiaceae bacterium]|jgi:hypothetical protein|nr:hypothetical protein [Polyangiaceae bacterium]
MARKRTGSLYWTKSGRRARLTIDVDGEAIQKSFDLETTDRAAAKAKLRRLLKQSAPELRRLQLASPSPSTRSSGLLGARR